MLIELKVWATVPFEIHICLFILQF